MSASRSTKAAPSSICCRSRSRDRDQHEPAAAKRIADRPVDQLAYRICQRRDRRKLPQARFAVALDPAIAISMSRRPPSASPTAPLTSLPIAYVSVAIDESCPKLDLL